MRKIEIKEIVSDPVKKRGRKVISSGEKIDEVSGGDLFKFERF